MTANSRRWTIGLAVTLAILLAFTVDQPIARAMNGLNPDILKIAAFITWFGQGGVVLYPTGILVVIGLALRSLRPDLNDRLNWPIRALAFIFVAVAAAGLADDALKIIFGRARPYLWLKGDMSGFGFFRYGAKFASFPSGHTTTSFAVALALGALLPRCKPLFLGAALAIGGSRIVLDVHYLSDVIAGAALGSGIGILARNRFMQKAWLTFPS